MVRLCLSMQPSFIALVNVDLDLVDVGPLFYVNLANLVRQCFDSVRQCPTVSDSNLTVLQQSDSPTSCPTSCPTASDSVRQSDSQSFPHIRTYSHIFAHIRTIFAPYSHTDSHIFARYSHIRTMFAQVRTRVRKQFAQIRT